MDDGMYQIFLETPMGKMQGNLLLQTKDGNVSGFIEAMGGKNFFKEGSSNNHIYEFSGNINYFLGNISYQAKAEVEGKNLVANVITNLGNFKIQGKKIEE